VKRFAVIGSALSVGSARIIDAVSTRRDYKAVGFFITMIRRKENQY